MRLTGTALPILLAIAAVAALVGIVLAWSRVPGPRWVRAALRFLLLAVNQLTAALLVGVLANDAGDFYSSWSDLLARGGHAAVARPQARPRPTPPAGVLTADDAGRTSRKQWPVDGRLVEITLSGAASQLRATAYVYLPPQYFQARYAKNEFPAIELLTGYGSSPNDLVGRGGAPDALLNLIRTGAVPPAVLVITTAAPGTGRDTQCTDVPAGPQAATFAATDVPLAISRAYRVAPVGWGIAGTGEGGYCAAKLAMLHADVFYAAAAITGYFTPVRTAATGELWGGSAVQRRLDDLAWRLRHLPAPPTRLLLLDTSGATAFARLARAPMQVTVQQVTGQPVPAALSWLGTRLPASD